MPQVCVKEKCPEGAGKGFETTVGWMTDTLGTAPVFSGSPCIFMEASFASKRLADMSLASASWHACRAEKKNGSLIKLEKKSKKQLQRNICVGDQLWYLDTCVYVTYLQYQWELEGQIPSCSPDCKVCRSS